MMILRKRSPELPRIFSCPWPMVVGTLAILGCIYLLYSLPMKTLTRFLIWNLIGIAIYFLYSRARSVLVKGSARDQTALMLTSVVRPRPSAAISSPVIAASVSPRCWWPKA